MFDLDGHVAVVTGGNGGIGLGMARGLIRAGAQVALWGRNAAKNERAVTELGERCAAFTCDVASEASVGQAMGATLDRFGRVDSCFANAGVRGESKRFADLSLDEWNSVMNVNSTGAFLTFRAMTRHMTERGGGGSLVVTSSIGSEFGIPRGEHYAASKAAVCALVRSLAVELARHEIRANAILPGWIDTDMTDHAKNWKEMNDAIVHRTPMKRWGAADDFGAIAVYFASPASRFHTGDVVRIDGGYSIF